jgi:hypothetical protein
MSEEKLYAVKNGKGEYWDFEDNLRFNRFELASRPLTSSNDLACRAAFKYHGHVVTFIQEPEKVVLTKEQAEIVEKARVSDIPATYISSRTNNGEESLLMNAYVNGYTVANEKKYNVKVPHTKDVWYFKASEAYLLTISDKKLRSEFTEAEIEQYGLQDCEKEEVTDDAD